MKILVISGYDPAHPEKISGVDAWRVYRPMTELKKHVDWQIDFQRSFIPGMEKYKDAADFTKFEMELAANHLGTYDLVFSTYFSNVATYLLARVVQQRHGTQLIMDCDDDYWHINDDNPILLKLSPRQRLDVQTMLSDVSWLTTTTERLARSLRGNRKLPADTVAVLPNGITDDFQHPPLKPRKRVTIGYMGSVTHWDDIHETGFSKALQRVVRDFPQVDVRAICMPIDLAIAEKRMTFLDPVGGLDYQTKLFPKFNSDIMVAPLMDNPFNWSKSNIKWQEYTRAGAAVIASNIGPYHDSLRNNINALLVKNTRGAWYDAMAELVEDTIKRKSLVAMAQRDLEAMTLENNWQHYRDFFERVFSAKFRKEFVGI